MYIFISFFGLIFTLPIFWLLGKIIKLNLFVKFLKLWIDLLFINFIISILLISNPYQNYALLFVVFGSLYYLFFYVYSKRSLGFEILRDIFNDKKIKKRIDRDKKYFALLVTLYASVMGIVFFLGAGDMMIEFGKYNELSEEVMINKAGNILYDNSGIGAYNIGIYDEDKDSYYETVKYDINWDGKADIVHIDTNGDLEIDEIIYKDYNEKRIPIVLIFFITCVIALIIIIKSGKTLKEVLKEIYKRKMEEDKIGIDVINGGDQINLRSLNKQPDKKGERIEKELHSISFDDLIKQKLLKKKSDNVNNSKIQENKFSIEQEQENLNKLNDLLINGVIDNETYERKGKEIKDRIENLKNKDKDIGKDLGKTLKSIIIFSVFSISIFCLLLKDAVFALQISDISQVQSRHPKCVNQPYDDDKCIGVGLEYRKFFQHLKNPTFKKEFDTWLEKTQKTDNSPGEKIELTKERNNRWNKWKKIDPNDSIYSNSFKYNELYNSKYKNYSWETNNKLFEDERVKKLYKQIGNSGTQETIDYLNYLNGLNNYETFILEGSSNLLKNINILNQKNDINEASNKQQIINYFEKRGKDYGLKGDYLNYINIINQDSLINNNINFYNIENELGINIEKESPYRLLLSKLGTSTNNFQDYQRYSLIHGYSNKKILGMITLTNFIEHNLSSNPFDVSIMLVSNFSDYFGFNKIKNYMGNYKIGNIYRSIIGDSYRIPNNIVKKANNYFYNQMIGKTEQIKGGQKTNTIGKIQGTKKYIYGQNVLFFQKYSYKLENGIYIWIEGGKFLAKLLSGIIK
ncbi:MAG: hypothetical protein V3575_00225 [Candidatus Absconditabacteria bacterium]